MARDCSCKSCEGGETVCEFSLKNSITESQRLLLRRRLPRQPFPEAGKGSEVASDTIPTYAYNWCVSPMTPMAVAGVIWVPSESNIGYDPAEYAAELEIYARSLNATYGQNDVQFIYAQPAESLLDNITVPNIPAARKFTFESWPKSMQQTAVEMAKLAE